MREYFSCLKEYRANTYEIASCKGKEIKVEKKWINKEFYTNIVREILIYFFLLTWNIAVTNIK
jgi:hypothetical protein